MSVIWQMQSEWCLIAKLFFATFFLTRVDILRAKTAFLTFNANVTRYRFIRLLTERFLLVFWSATWYSCRLDTIVVENSISGGRSHWLYLLCRVGFIARRLRRPINGTHVLNLYLMTSGSFPTHLPTNVTEWHNIYLKQYRRFKWSD